MSDRYAKSFEGAPARRRNKLVSCTVRRSASGFTRAEEAGSSFLARWIVAADLRSPREAERDGGRIRAGRVDAPFTAARFVNESRGPCLARDRRGRIPAGEARGNCNRRRERVSRSREQQRNEEVERRTLGKRNREGKV